MDAYDSASIDAISTFHYPLSVDFPIEQEGFFVLHLLSSTKIFTPKSLILLMKKGLLGNTFSLNDGTHQPRPQALPLRAM